MSAQHYSRPLAPVLLLVGLLAGLLITGCSPSPVANPPAQTQPAPLPTLPPATPLPTRPPVEATSPAYPPALRNSRPPSFKP